MLLVFDLCARCDSRFTLLPWVSFLRGKGDCLEGTLPLLLYLTTLLDFPVEILFCDFLSDCVKLLLDSLAKQT